MIKIKPKEEINIEKKTQEPEVNKELIALFMECKDRFVYNPVFRSADFSKRRATDYKLNRDIKLPKPMSGDLEFDCEVRRREYLRQFRDYLTETDAKDKKMKNKKNKEDNIANEIDHKQDKICKNKVVNGGGKRIKRTVSRKNKNPRFLNKNEILALKSLKTRIKTGQIIVSQTDKSSRFSVMSRTQYLESGQIHTKNDKKIGHINRITIVS